MFMWNRPGWIAGLPAAASLLVTVSAAISIVPLPQLRLGPNYHT